MDYKLKLGFTLKFDCFGTDSSWSQSRAKLIELHQVIGRRTELLPFLCGMISCLLVSFWTAGEFSCTGNHYCIPLSWKCDGERDCSDGSDETACHNNSCEAWQFQVRSRPAGFLGSIRQRVVLDLLVFSVSLVAITLVPSYAGRLSFLVKLVLPSVYLVLPSFT